MIHECVLCLLCSGLASLRSADRNRVKECYVSIQRTPGYCCLLPYREVEVTHTCRMCSCTL